MSDERELVVLNIEMRSDEAGWWHLVPKGRFVGSTLTGRRVEQVIDDKAISDLVANFTPKVLVDFEHRSHAKEGDTTAAAWITQVEARADGLWGIPELSDMGRLAVENKRYRFISPVLDLDKIDEKSGRAKTLIDAGLTNKANMRKALTPLFNKEDSSGTPPEGEEAKAEEARRRMMQNIAKALGLPETADEAACLAAIDALKGKATSGEAAMNRVTEFETRELNAKVEKALTDHAKKITAANKVAIEAQLRKDFDGTMIVLNAMPEPKAETRVLNREDGKTPEDADAIAMNKERDEYVEKVRVENRLQTKAEAWTIASQQKPELFVTK